MEHSHARLDKMYASLNLEMHGGNLGMISGSIFSDHKLMQIVFSPCSTHPKRGNLRIPNKILKNVVIEQLVINY